MRIHNGRPLADRFEFEREGFRFVPHRSRVADFMNDDEVRRVYYPECEELIKQVSGAKRVVVFDHTLRTASGTQRETRKIRDIVSRVHNDYTEWSGPQRVRDIMGDEAEALLQGRFAIIQVWRPINHPVESHPLAICDAQTVKPETPRHQRAALSRPGRPDLRDHLRSGAALVLVPAHAARRSPGVQGLRVIARRPRPLDRAHRLQGPDRPAARPPARKHRNPHAGVFLNLRSALPPTLGPLVQLRFAAFAVTSLRGDLHPQECADAERTKNGRGKCRARPGGLCDQRRPGVNGPGATATGTWRITGAGKSSGTDIGAGLARDASRVVACFACPVACAVLA